MQATQRTDTASLGTEFVTRPMAVQPLAVRPSTVSETRPRILYVDDEPELRGLGELALSQAGYVVDTAADGAEGWEALQQAHYNLLITDNNMPRLTGVELAARARLVGMRLPILLTSGSACALNDPSTEGLGLSARLPKPFGSDDLVSAVGQVIRSATKLSQCTDAKSSGTTPPDQIEPYLHGGINE